MQGSISKVQVIPGWIILAVLLLVPFVSTASTLDPFHAWRWLLIALGAAAGLAALTLAPAPIPPLPASLALGCVLFSAVSAVAAGNRSEAVWQVVQQVSWCAWFLLLSAEARRRGDLSTRVRRAAVACALGAAGYAIADYWGMGGERAGLGLGPVGFQGNRNLVASLQFLLAPWILWALLKEAGPVRWAAAAAWIGFAYALALTQSRAVWMGCLAAAACGLALLSMAGPGEARTRLIRRRGVLLFAALGMAGAFLFHGAVKPASDTRAGSAARASTILDPSFDSNAQRLALWKKTLALIEANPWSGVGAGNWKLEVLSTGMSGLLWSDMEAVEVRPYNDWLWTFAEIGIPGGLCWLGLWAAGLWAGVRAARRREMALPVLLLASGLFGFGLVSALDFPKERPEHMAWYAAGLAVLLAMGRSRGGAARAAPPRPAFAALLILASVSAAFASVRWRSEGAVREAMSAHAAGDWPGVVTSVSRLRGGVCTLNPAASPMAWHAGIARHQAGDPAGAEAAFREALASHPWHILSIHNLAVCRLQAGDSAEAAALLARALEISPAFPEAALASALLALRRGEPAAPRRTLDFVDDRKRGPAWQSVAALIASQERTQP